MSIMVAAKILFTFSVWVPAVTGLSLGKSNVRSDSKAPPTGAELEGIPVPKGWKAVAMMPAPGTTTDTQDTHPAVRANSAMPSSSFSAPATSPLDAIMGSPQSDPSFQPGNMVSMNALPTAGPPMSGAPTGGEQLRAGAVVDADISPSNADATDASQSAVSGNAYSMEAAMAKLYGPQPSASAGVADQRTTQQMVASKNQPSASSTAIVASQDAPAAAGTDMVASRDAPADASTDMVAGRDAPPAASTDMVASKDAPPVPSADTVSSKDAQVVLNRVADHQTGTTLASAHSDEEEDLNQAEAKLLRKMQRFEKFERDQEAKKQAKKEADEQAKKVDAKAPAVSTPAVGASSSTVAEQAPQATVQQGRDGDKAEGEWVSSRSGEEMEDGGARNDQNDPLAVPVPMVTPTIEDNGAPFSAALNRVAAGIEKSAPVQAVEKWIKTRAPTLAKMAEDALPLDSEAGESEPASTLSERDLNKIQSVNCLAETLKNGDCVTPKAVPTAAPVATTVASTVPATVVPSSPVTTTVDAALSKKAAPTTAPLAVKAPPVEKTAAKAKVAQLPAHQEQKETTKEHGVDHDIKAHRAHRKHQEVEVRHRLRTPKV